MLGNLGGLWTVCKELYLFILQRPVGTLICLEPLNVLFIVRLRISRTVRPRYNAIHRRTHAGGDDICFEFGSLGGWTDRSTGEADDQGKRPARATLCQKSSGTRTEKVLPSGTIWQRSGGRMLKVGTVNQNPRFNRWQKLTHLTS